MPRLIIERNVHGIDIDPRAVQIAGLSLWLRAQRSWAAMGLSRDRRPQIRKANIVCAQPMPGDQKMLEEFLASLDETHLERLLRQVLRLPAARPLRVTKAMAKALAGLVRTAVERLGGASWYYADYPYVLQSAQDLEALERDGWAPRLFRISSGGLSAWKRSVAAHRSQISTFWPDLSAMQADLDTYLGQSGGIVLWNPQKSKPN